MPPPIPSPAPKKRSAASAAHDHLPPPSKKVRRVEVSTQTEPEPDPMEELLDELEKEVTCGICREVLYQPVQITGCLHGFCGSCLVQWVDNKGTACPTCRVAPSPSYAIHHSPTLASLSALLLASRPDRAKPEAEKREMERRWAPGKEIVLGPQAAHDDDMGGGMGGGAGMGGIGGGGPEQWWYPCIYCNGRDGYTCPQPIPNPDHPAVPRTSLLRRGINDTPGHASCVACGHLTAYEAPTTSVCVCCGDVYCGMLLDDCHVPHLIPADIVEEGKRLKAQWDKLQEEAERRELEQDERDAAQAAAQTQIPAGEESAAPPAQPAPGDPAAQAAAQAQIPAGEEATAAAAQRAPGEAAASSSGGDAPAGVETQTAATQTSAPADPPAAPSEGAAAASPAEPMEVDSPVAAALVASVPVQPRPTISPQLTLHPHTLTFTGPSSELRLLRNNPTELRYLAHYLHASSLTPTDVLHAMLREAVAHEHGFPGWLEEIGCYEAGGGEDGAADLEKVKMCGICLGDAWCAGVTGWWMRERKRVVETGGTVEGWERPDCWDGFNCGRQGVPAHAIKYNHICNRTPTELRNPPAAAAPAQQPELALPSAVTEPDAAPAAAPAQPTEAGTQTVDSGAGADADAVPPPSSSASSSSSGSSSSSDSSSSSAMDTDAAIPTSTSSDRRVSGASDLTLVELDAASPTEEGASLPKLVQDPPMAAEELADAESAAAQVAVAVPAVVPP